jgi:hypothetical protein
MLENILSGEHPSTLFGTLRVKREDDGIFNDVMPLIFFSKSVRKSMNLDNSLESVDETEEQSTRKKILMKEIIRLKPTEPKQRIKYDRQKNAPRRNPPKPKKNSSPYIYESISTTE